MMALLEPAQEHLQVPTYSVRLIYMLTHYLLCGAFTWGQQVEDKASGCIGSRSMGRDNGPVVPLVPTGFIVVQTWQEFAGPSAMSM